MSGGSLDYVYERVNDAAGMVRARATTPQHEAFAAHLSKVAEALRAVEWVWSCDSAEGSENDAIMRCITPSDVLAEATEKAIAARDSLIAVIESVHAQVHQEAK